MWKNLGSAKQKAINLALLYGKPGSGKSLSGTEDQKWVATQLIVWEFVSGCRSTTEKGIENIKSNLARTTHYKILQQKEKIYYTQGSD